MPARILICRYVDCRQEVRIETHEPKPPTCKHCRRTAYWLVLDREDEEDRDHLTPSDRRFLRSLRISPAGLQ